jgi:hypothetical protein
MNRNLKALGLALIAAFALSAVLASAASAQVGTLTSTGPVTLIATQTGEASANQITAFGGTIQCPNTQYTGHKYNVTPHTFIPNDISTTTVTSHSGTCTFKVGANSFLATVDMNGCDFVFHIEGTTPGVDTYTVRATVVCEATKHMVVTIYGTAAKHAANEPFCNLTITENAAGYLGLHATDLTNGKVSNSGTIAGISVDKKSPTGSLLCPEETTNAASFAIDIASEGKSEGGTATSISLSHL